MGGAENVEAINFRGIDDGNGEVESGGMVEAFEEGFASCGGEGFGVVEFQQGCGGMAEMFGGKEGGGGNDGSCEGAASGFIDPGKTRNAALEKSGVFDGQSVGVSGGNAVR